MAVECCYTCLNYVDALCTTRDDKDDEDPDTYKCELYDPDPEEIGFID